MKKYESDGTMVPNDFIPVNESAHQHPLETNHLWNQCQTKIDLRVLLCSINIILIHVIHVKLDPQYGL